jgi:hypothetical protein
MLFVLIIYNVLTSIFITIESRCFRFLDSIKKIVVELFIVDLSLYKMVIMLTNPLTILIWWTKHGQQFPHIVILQAK